MKNPILYLVIVVYFTPIQLALKLYPATFEFFSDSVGVCVSYQIRIDCRDVSPIVRTSLKGRQLLARAPGLRGPVMLQN